MSERTDGGPAFPVHEQWSEWSDLKAEYVPRTGPRGGMSLRDWFAGQAFNGAIACGILTKNLQNGHDLTSALQGLAHDSYLAADAMIAERAK